MYIFLLGATGMLGHKMVEALRSSNLTVVALDSRDYDLSHEPGIRQLVSILQPEEIVVNCAGLIRQRLSPSPTPAEMRQSFMLNAMLPQLIARSKAHLIHFSTDCVFSGEEGSYVEEDFPDPVDVYGRTKILGEPENAMVLRQSIVGPELDGRPKLGLFEWFMSQHEVKGFTNHLWNGLTTNELSRCINQILEEQLYKNKGVYHLHSDTVSKYELLKLFSQHKSVHIEEVRVGKRIDRTLSSNRSLVDHLKIRPLEEQVKDML